MSQPQMLIGKGGQNDFKISGGKYNMDDSHMDRKFASPRRSDSMSKVIMMAGGGAGEMVVQKPLPYPLNGLEPVISENLMSYHYGKHHTTYVNNLNGLIGKAKAALDAGNTLDYVELSQAIKFNGGGHLNHEFFWESLSPVDKDGGKLDK